VCFTHRCLANLKRSQCSVLIPLLQLRQRIRHKRVCRGPSARHKTQTGMSYNIYYCPVLHQCKCIKTIRVGRENGLLILEQCCLHDLSSHEQDGSKYLKYEQIISLTEAAVTMPNLSGAVIGRNMLLHDSPSKTIGAEHKSCIMRLVRSASKHLTTKQPGGFSIAEGFSNLTDFCMCASIMLLRMKITCPSITTS
jgi:hypothetical protein